VEPALQKYKRIVAEQPVCQEEWFADKLAQYRAGDENGARAISGSCLRFALQLAERHAADCPEDVFFDFIEEANAGLMEALTTYSGSELKEFLVLAEQKIDDRLSELA
jgi:DNA-directed RNA polymerase specialized sigma subunit